MSKADYKGRAMVEEFISSGLTVDESREKALKIIESMEGAIPNIKGGALVMKKTLNYLSDLKEVINTYGNEKEA